MDMRRNKESDRPPLGAVHDGSSNVHAQVNHDVIAGRHGLPSDTLPPLGATSDRPTKPYTEVNHDAMDLCGGLPSDRVLLGRVPDRSTNTHTHTNQGMRGAGFFKPLPPIIRKTEISHDIMAIRRGARQLATYTHCQNDTATHKGLPSQKSPLGVLDQEWKAKFKLSETCDSMLHKTNSDTVPHSLDIMAIERGLPSQRAPLGNIKQTRPIKAVTKPHSEDMFDRSFFNASLRNDLPTNISDVDKQILAIGALTAQNEFVSQSETFGDTENDTLATNAHETCTAVKLHGASEERRLSTVGEPSMSNDFINSNFTEELRFIDSPSSEELRYIDSTSSEKLRYNDSTSSEKLLYIDSTSSEKLRYIDSTSTEELRYIDNTSTEEFRAYDIDGTKAGGILKTEDKVLVTDAASKQTDKELTCDASCEHENVTSQMQARYVYDSIHHRNVEEFKTMTAPPTIKDSYPKPIENEKFENNTIRHISETDTRTVQTKMFTDKPNHESDADTLSIRSDIFSSTTLDADTESIQIFSDKASDICASGADIQSIQSEIFPFEIDEECIDGINEFQRTFKTEKRTNNVTDEQKIENTLFADKSSKDIVTDVQGIQNQNLADKTVKNDSATYAKEIQSNVSTTKVKNGIDTDSSIQIDTERGSIFPTGPTQIGRMCVNKDDQGSENENGMVGPGTADEIQSSCETNEGNSKVMMSNVQTQTGARHKNRAFSVGVSEVNVHKRDVASQAHVRCDQEPLSDVFAKLMDFLAGEKTTAKTDGGAVDIINAVTSLIGSVGSLKNNEETSRFNNASTINHNTMDCSDETYMNEYRTDSKSSKLSNKLQTTNGLKLIKRSVTASIGTQTDYTIANNEFNWIRSPFPESEQTNTCLNKKTNARKLAEDAGICNGTQTSYFPFNDENKPFHRLTQTYVNIERDDYDYIQALKYADSIESPPSSTHDVDQHSECKVCIELVKSIETCKARRIRCRQGPYVVEQLEDRQGRTSDDDIWNKNRVGPSGVRQQEDKQGRVAEDYDGRCSRYRDGPYGVGNQEDKHGIVPDGKVVENPEPSNEPRKPPRAAWAKQQNALNDNWNSPTTATFILHETDLDAFKYPESYRNFTDHKPPRDAESYRNSRDHNPPRNAESYRNSRDHNPSRDAESYRNSRDHNPPRNAESYRNSRDHKPPRDAESYRNSRDHKPPRNAESYRNSRDHKPPRDAESYKNSRDHKPPRDAEPYRHSRDHKPPRDAESYRNSRDHNPPRNAESYRNSRDHKPPRDAESYRNSREHKPPRDAESYRNSRDHKPPRNAESYRNSREHKPPRDAESYRNSRDHKPPRDAESYRNPRDHKPPRDGDEETGDKLPRYGDEEREHKLPRDGDEEREHKPPRDGDEEREHKPPQDVDKEREHKPPRDGEREHKPPLDGDKEREHKPPRDGDEEREHKPPRDGDKEREHNPPRDGDEEREHKLPRDGDEEREHKPPREGDEEREHKLPRDGDGEREHKPPRDAESYRNSREHKPLRDVESYRNSRDQKPTRDGDEERGEYQDAWWCSSRNIQPNGEQFTQNFSRKQNDAVHQSNFL